MTIYEKEDQSLVISKDSLFENCEFKGIDFSNYDLKSASFMDCKFTGCNLANQKLVNSSMRDVSFENCNMIGINWCSLKRFENPEFRESKMNFSVFQGLKLKKVKMINCSMIEADLSDMDLSSADFSGTFFMGANFERSNLSGADFRGSRDYVFDLRTAKIKGAKFSVPDVISLITALGAEVDF